MRSIERTIVLLALANVAVYIPFFAIQMLRASAGDVHPDPLTILPWHFAGMFLNLLALVVTLRDLYLRNFANPNSKLTWCLLILCTGGLGWLVYVFRHGLRPR